MPSSIWIGADPGGRRNFGVAIICDDEIATLCVSSAAEAAVEVRKRCKRAPNGIGVDAPLWWSAGESGDRLADQRMRESHRLSGGQVQTGNSLRGAALIQGMMFVRLMRDAFPNIPVTESHPNAVLNALGMSWEKFRKTFGITVVPKSKHEQDAIVGAVAAREGFEGRWRMDLSLSRSEHEQDPATHWIGPVHYWWPDA